MKQICGIILEGQSCSGKTSIYNAIKACHMIDDTSERNVIYLSEHYSQNLNWVNGKLQKLSREENLRVLANRLSMLEQLSDYADAMGEHSRRSRGLFFVFERFHLNFAFVFNEIATTQYREIESRLCKLNAHTALSTISNENIMNRLTHRAALTNDKINQEYIAKYTEEQQRFIDIADQSLVPTIIINTDEMAWTQYARSLLESIHQK